MLVHLTVKQKIIALLFYYKERLSTILCKKHIYLNKKAVSQQRDPLQLFVKGNYRYIQNQLENTQKNQTEIEIFNF